MQTPEKSATKSETPSKSDAVLLSVILFLSFIKFLQYLRIYKSAGQIIRLSFNVFRQTLAFSLFFYLYNLFIALEYKALKVQRGHDDPDPKGTGHGEADDYERLSEFAGYYLYTFRNSIGDLEVPNAEVWQDSPFMVYFIWVIWLFHLYFMLIVFLNFLIAIIS